LLQPNAWPIEIVTCIKLLTTNVLQNANSYIQNVAEEVKALWP